MDEDRTLLIRDMHVPRTCEKCGAGSPQYKGVGEYKCSECGHVMYDDFGLVRNYLETHRGATQVEVCNATGVSRETVRQLLRDDKIEIVAGSGVFMACELCQAPIRSGRYCVACAQKIEKQKDAERTAGHRPSMQGFGQAPRGESGARRYTR